MQRLIISAAWLLCLGLFAVTSESRARDSREKKQEYTLHLRRYILTIDRAWSASMEGRWNGGTLDSLTKGYEAIKAKLSPQKRKGLEERLQDLRSDRRLSELGMKLKDYRQAVLDSYRVVTIPAQNPDYWDGKALYGQYCAACHGDRGQGDGKLAQNKRFPMRPAPTDLQVLMAGGLRSPFSIYNLLLVGIEGSMEPFDVLLKDEERWNLAFYLMARPFDGSASHEYPANLVSRVAAKDQALLRDVAGSLEILAILTDLELEERIQSKIPEITAAERRRLVLTLRRGLSFSTHIPRSG